MITLLDKQGREIQEQDKIMERIEEFYPELFDSDQAVTIQTDPKEVPPIMAWEVEAALRKMKNVKEAGKDQVNIETLKAGDETEKTSRTTDQFACYQICTNCSQKS